LGIRIQVDISGTLARIAGKKDGFSSTKDSHKVKDVLLALVLKMGKEEGELIKVITVVIGKEAR